MILMLLGLALWYVTHLMPAWAPERRAALAAPIGETAYKGVIALVTLGAVALMVVGYQQANFVTLWTPPAFLVHLNNLLMIVAVIVFVSGKLPSHVRRAVRHPQLIAVKTWAVAHLLVNGDLASVVLFGGMLGWGVLAMIGTNRRDGKPARTVAATAAGTALNVGLGLAVFGIVAWVHGSLLGVWPFPG